MATDTQLTVIMDYHDLIKGHIRLTKARATTGDERYELHIGSRQIGFGVDGSVIYCETNYALPRAGTSEKDRAEPLVPTVGHDAECGECARYGADSDHRPPRTQTSGRDCRDSVRP